MDGNSESTSSHPKRVKVEVHEKEKQLVQEENYFPIDDIHKTLQRGLNTQVKLETAVYFAGFLQSMTANVIQNATEFARSERPGKDLRIYKSDVKKVIQKESLQNLLELKSQYEAGKKRNKNLSQKTDTLNAKNTQTKKKKT